MNIVTTIEEWKRIQKNHLKGSVGFVPTMGNLHEGHTSLIARSSAENEKTVVSIFVNPTQFNQTDDFKHYPRTLEQDIPLLSSCSVDYVLVPDVSTLYPDNYTIQISETDISQTLEGACRPGHFTGMLTVVLKLLNLVQPTRAYFGEKDYQQYLLIKKMADALFLSPEIISCETIRAADGLALSSRNNRLTDEQRLKAASFPALLKTPLSHSEITEKLISLGFKVDYVADKWGRRLGAVSIDTIRLIDNFCME